MRGSITAVIGGFVIGAGITVAPHASADSGTFIKLLDASNVSYQSAQDAVEWGNASCSNLRRGQGVGSVINGLSKIGGFSSTDAGKLTRAASMQLCPDQDGKVAAWAEGVMAGAG